ncbi:unnamed protein product [Nezara viridula]|uniref:Uncharacterized protein n=1 Tax=Nezara viridula TaxID=85310 RepID=A0A9P0HDL1_NEZVI|nr:unnamed protein product [Nezara viridula]
MLTKPLLVSYINGGGRLNGIGVSKEDMGVAYGVLYMAIICQLCQGTIAAALAITRISIDKNPQMQTTRGAAPVTGRPQTISRPLFRDLPPNNRAGRVMSSNYRSGGTPSPQTARGVSVP